MHKTHILKAACFFLILLGSASVFSEVRENTRYERYVAQHQQGQSLLKALNQASTVRWQGRVYHGFTQWNVTWRFYWQDAPDGRCSISRNQTTVDAVMTLPELATNDPEARKTFTEYLERLREHELGHLEIARWVAREIDAGIVGLPSMSSCAALEKSANALGYQKLEAAILREQAYDRETGYGRSQGVWLPH